ncbi:MAG TPA: hypothetical protein VHG91_04095 [Longimicrobium sp.]|nr:hypothetical protein [Longimicrobium sp.]
MIVYAETNFILEVALLQEESENCEQILRLAEEGLIRLVLPAFSFVEPHGALNVRKAQRNRVKPELGSVLRELGRTAPYAPQVAVIKPVLHNLLQNSTSEETSRLQAARARIAAAAEVISLDQAILVSAAEYERAYRLSPQDAVVYASVRAHLERERPATSCFLNRNANDFDVPDLTADLRRFRCKMLTHFDQGYGYILSTP